MRARRVLATGFVVFGLAACRPSESHPEPPALPTLLAESSVPVVDAAPRSASLASSTVAPTSTASSKASFDLATSWSSASCPGRAYKRTLVLSADHTFRADDIVHPCAGECAVQWVDTRTGTWSSTGATVFLVVKDEDGPARERADAVALPSTLAIDAAGRALHESNAACAYASP